MPSMSRLKALLSFFVTVITIVYASTTNAAVTTFSYDELDRLQQVDYDNGTYFIRYDYDEIGNRRYIYASDAAPNVPPTVYHITASSSGNGYIFPSGTIPVNAGENITFTFSANPNHYLSDVLVDGVSVGISGTHTLSNVTSDQTVSARFITPDGDVAPVGHPDGILDVGDVVIALRTASGAEPLTPSALAHGDVYPLINGHPAPDGQITQDDANLINKKSNGTVSWDTSDNLVVHRATGAVTINGGATVTGNTAVMLTLSCTDSAGRCTQMQFSNDNVNWSNAETYASTKAWSLTSSDGHKVVYAIFRDAAGNWLTGSNATIRLDTMPPMTTATPTGLASNKNQNITLTCRDGAGSGCSKIYYTTNGAYPTSSSSVYSSPINITSTTVLNYSGVDFAGNIETFKSQTYIIDTTPPVTSATPSGGLLNDSLYIALYCNDAAGSGCNNIYYTTNGSTPSVSSNVYSTPIYIATSTTVKHFATDIAGNAETVKSQTYTIDQIPPVGTVTVNGGTAYTNTTAATLLLSCTDSTGACSQMQFSNDNTNWSTPEAYAATKTWMLASGDSNKTVYAKFKDTAGNWSTTVNDSILLDTTKPATTASSAGGPYNVTTSVTLICSDGTGSGCNKLYYTIDGTDPTTSSPVYSTPLSIAATTTLRYFSTDLAGNSEPLRSQVYIIDQTPPVGTIIINDEAAYTNTAVVNLSLSCTDSVGCSQMQFSNDNTTWSAPEAYAATKAWTLAAGDGNKAIYTRFKDTAGNWSTISSDAIVLDTTNPVTTVSPAEGIYNTAKIVTLTCSDGTGVGCNKIYYTTDGTPPTTTSSVYSGTITVAATTTLKYFATDLAGNGEAVTSQQYTIDTIPPVTTGSPTSGAYNTSQAVTLACSDGTGAGCDKIYFTTNGTTPTTSSSVYLNPIPVSSTTTLHFFATDLAGNSETVKTQTYTIDMIPPTGGITINGGAANTTASAVTLTLSCTDSVGCTEMQFSNDNTTWSAPEAFAATKAWTLATGDGTRTMYAKFKDLAGNWSVAYSDTILLDETAPVTTASPAGGYYNTGKAVALVSNDGAGMGVDKIYYTIDGTIPTTSSSVYSGQIDIVTTTTLKFFATDLIGNKETVKTQTYIIDTIAPTVVITSPASGTTTDNTPLLTYTATDATGVHNVIVKVDGIVVNKTSGNSLALLPDGSHTVRIEATDWAGNTGIAEVTFTVAFVYTGKEDFETGNLTLLPWVTTGDGQWFVQDADVHGDSYAAQAPSIASGQSAAMEVTTNCTAGSISFWYSVNSLFDTLTFSIDGVQQLSISGSDSWSQAAYAVTAGTHTFRWAYSNSMIIPRSDTVWIDDIFFPISAGDTTPPVTTASPAGGIYNESQMVALTCSDGTGSGCNKIYYTTDGTTPTTSSSVYSVPIAIAATKTFKYFSIDLAGNSESVNSQNYTIDYTAPSGTVSVNNNATYTTKAAVTLSLSCTDNAGPCYQMQFSNDNTNWSIPESYATTKAWTLTTGDGTKIIYVKYKDAAGNWSGTYVDSITLDSVAPLVTVISPIAGTTSDDTPPLTYTASEGAVVVKVDGSTVNKVSGNDLNTLTNGPHTVRVEATDAAGNTGFAEVAFTVSAPVFSEDFETGNLSRWPWVTSGNGPWAVKTTRVHSGAYAAQAPSIFLSQSATMEATIDCTAGNISFWYSIYSASDNIKFYIDGVQKLSKAGSASWTEAIYAVAAGRHSFKWVYSNSKILPPGANTAWIDDITFPVP